MQPASLRFFRMAIRHHGEPEVVSIGKSGANTLNAGKPEEETIRQNKYLNNLEQQDHRNIKRRIRPMLGFNSFRRAQTLLAGIELVHMIRKGQYQHPPSDGLSAAEQFYLLAAGKTGSATFADFTLLMRQSRNNCYFTSTSEFRQEIRRFFSEILPEVVGLNHAVLMTTSKFLNLHLQVKCVLKNIAPVLIILLCIKNETSNE